MFIFRVFNKISAAAGTFLLKKQYFCLDEQRVSHKTLASNHNDK